MVEKIQIFHFHNGNGGGVLSVIRNLLSHKQNANIENHVIYTINSDERRTYDKPNLFGATSETIFYFSPKANFYSTCKRLSALLPNRQAVIIAHDWLELGMVSNLGLSNPVVQILHGDYDYYYNLALLHKSSVDCFLCVSSVIERKLRVLMPRESVLFLRFPVPDVTFNEVDYTNLRIAFFVRDLTDENKQFKLLPQIESMLIEYGINVKWFIAGGGMQEDEVVSLWGESYSQRVNFFGELNKEEINGFLKNCNIMILPSLVEGFPVVVVEAMKYGLVPLVSYWEGAVSDLVLNEQTGYSFIGQDPKSYAVCLQELDSDSSKLNYLSRNAKKKVDELFNPFHNTLAYEKAFGDVVNNTKIKYSFKALGSRLDNPLFPNIFVVSVRIFIRFISQLLRQ